MATSNSTTPPHVPTVPIDDLPPLPDIRNLIQEAFGQVLLSTLNKDHLQSGGPLYRWDETTQATMEAVSTAADTTTDLVSFALCGLGDLLIHAHNDDQPLTKESVLGISSLMAILGGLLYGIHDAGASADIWLKEAGVNHD